MVATDKPNVVICIRPVTAYNPANSGLAMGEFQTDSTLTIGEKDPSSGMFAVTYQNKDGTTVNALCRADDLGR